MLKTLSTQEAIRAAGVLLGKSGERSDITIVEQDGDPIAVIMRPDAYYQLADAQAEHDWAIIDQLRERNRDKDPKQVERDIEEAIEAARLARRQARMSSSLPSARHNDFRRLDRDTPAATPPPIQIGV